jgi:type IV secretory pathway ATPase VirB11/archaellum biosynthesis ATPase
MLERLAPGSESPACECDHESDGGTLSVDATACEGGGDIGSAPACRRAVVIALGETSDDRIRVDTGALVRWYDGEAAALLGAAGRFAARVSRRDTRLASLARGDPLAAADAAADRAGLVNEVAAETGLLDFAGVDRDTEQFLAPAVSPAIAASRLDPHPPADGTLRTSRVTESGATVRIYDRDGAIPTYHLEPIEYTLGESSAETLRAARERLLESTSGADTSTPLAAVSAVAGPETPVDTLGTVLEKHTTGLGVFEDLFSDGAVDEVFVNAPAAATPLHVRVDGAEMRTNVRLSERGADRLAARLRAESGRAFSRASPTIDATLSAVGTAPVVRVSGVREPASDGLAFALRAEGTDEWRLGRLVGLGTLSSEAAGLLSVAMARGGALLIAGPRGAGKTTMASALLWELPPATRLLAIEDTPELPVTALQAAGRDAQRIEAASGFEAEIDPASALRTALRFGDGALAVGEVRGEEAGVLYEAMRVGAASDTVIGTIHGEGYEGVKERVVADLGVPESSFGATDLLVTLAPLGDGKRVTSIEEVTDTGGATLFEYHEGGLEVTPRLERGNSRLVADLAAPDETYADVMTTIKERAADIAGWRSGRRGDGPGRTGRDEPGLASREETAHG